MRPLGWYVAKIKEKITHSHEPVNAFYRKKGMKVGENCLICTYLLSKEPFLIEIGNNVTISTNVTFVTHDNCVKLLHPKKSDLFGKIKICDNCFIGENSTILYGVTIPEKTIVAAGSVVTKSFTENEIIIGGNPAKKIGDWTTFKEKTMKHAVSRTELHDLLRKGYGDDVLVKR